MCRGACDQHALVAVGSPPGRVDAEDDRQRRSPSRPPREVDVVDAGRLDPDQELVVLGLRIRGVLVAKLFRPALLVEDDSLHGREASAGRERSASGGDAGIPLVTP
jgi:hypothetical protein